MCRVQRDLRSPSPGDRRRRVMISGSIHYARSTPEMWPDLTQKSKDGGLEVRETYKFSGTCMKQFAARFSSFGDPVPYRPAEDLPFSVAHFYQLGGTYQNYYMYHGGTNFGRTSGGPFITTSYDYDAPIDEYGLLRQPKWGHLKDVHKAIKLCEEAMVATDPETSSLGSNLEATVYKTKSGLCGAFLANVGMQSDATVSFNGNSYKVPAWSVSILPDCKCVALNTPKINSGHSLKLCSATFKR